MRRTRRSGVAAAAMLVPLVASGVLARADGGPLPEAGPSVPAAPASHPPRPSSLLPAVAAPLTATPRATTAGAVAAPMAPQEVRATVAASRSAGAGSAPRPGRPSSRATRAAAPSGYQGRWGVVEADFPGSVSSLDGLEASLGRRADYVMWYVHWGGPYGAFDRTGLDKAEANGSTPVITWMSDDPWGSTVYTDAAIAAGTYDGYIRSWAAGLAAYGRPVLLRFDHEMNCTWYDWVPGVHGNTPAGFVAAWRHVYAVFAAAGATNVTFVWSPNIDFHGASASLPSLYPGDPYVGMVGVDGYNWGPSGYHTWQTAAQVFGPTLAELPAITSKPQLIAEVGSTSVGGDKAAWIT
ncbi:MAG TPA: glycosyl hydrolase, partial [Acidimicrobiales bacterium]|nr:glycosyl hydrolase [Acidimicrobiales bacterium]